MESSSYTSGIIILGFGWGMKAHAMKNVFTNVLIQKLQFRKRRLTPQIQLFRILRDAVSIHKIVINVPLQDQKRCLYCCQLLVLKVGSFKRQANIFQPPSSKLNTGIFL